RTDAEDMARVVERQERPRRRLREIEHRAPSRQQVLQIERPFAGLRDAPDPSRELAEIVEQATVENPGVDHVEQPRLLARGGKMLGAYVGHSGFLQSRAGVSCRAAPGPGRSIFRARRAESRRA